MKNDVAVSLFVHVFFSYKNERRAELQEQMLQISHDVEESYLVTKGKENETWGGHHRVLHFKFRV